MAKSVTAQDLKRMLTDGDELALVDVREEGVFAKGHLLFAASLPLSRLEMMADDRLPCRRSRIVIMDAGEGYAATAAGRLAGFGYVDVAVLDGGLDGWRDAGFEVFTGVNVPSKAFGEIVEHRCKTPQMTPDDVQARITAGDDMVILDSRPLDEFRRMNIPGGIDVPGAELVYRLHTLAPDPDTLVVVNCAGRTRSIIGAQSLINAGVPNRVVDLKDGTMGWLLAGLDLEHGQTRSAPEPRADALAVARARAEGVAERYGVERIDQAGLTAWQDEAADRTLYVFDVRGPDEYAAGHLAGSLNAPGGQLVQATDEFMPVRHARVVLVDDTEVRAIMTASWLVQMGWKHVRVLAGGLGDDGLQTGALTPAVLGLRATSAYSVDHLRADLDAGGVTVLDLASSADFNRGHVPGAWWGVRARLGDEIGVLPEVRRVVLMSPDGILAHVAALEVAALFPTIVTSVVAGGTAAWAAAGHPLEEGLDRCLGATDDLWRKPYEQVKAGGERQAMEDYLTWEVALVEQIERDGTTDFHIP